MLKPLEDIMKKEVTRKEFLTMSGFGIASLFGLGTIIKLLTGHGSSKTLTKSTLGYGDLPYGGRKPKA